jgi:hypothetical protein
MIRDYSDPKSHPMHSYFALVGIWRHGGPLLLRPGTYRVIGPRTQFNAVMDDFGTLVEVV